MSYHIVTAATAGSPYAPLLALHDYAETYLVPDRGSWEENTKIKPGIIRAALTQHDCVMWIDADCRFDPPPARPEGNWDVAICQNPCPSHAIRFSAAHFLVRNTKRGRLFLTHWEKINRARKKDHPAMRDALRSSCPMIYDATGWAAGRFTVNAYLPERGVHAS